MLLAYAEKKSGGVDRTTEEEKTRGGMRPARGSPRRQAGRGADSFRPGTAWKPSRVQDRDPCRAQGLESKGLGGARRCSRRRSSKQNEKEPAPRLREPALRGRGDQPLYRKRLAAGFSARTRPRPRSCGAPPRAHRWSQGGSKAFRLCGRTARLRYQTE